MNQVAIQQKSFAAGEEMRGGGGGACRSVEMIKEPVVCPKPRRLGLLHATLNEPSYLRPLKWNSSHHQEFFDAKAGNELLDILLAKGNNCGGADQSATPIASSPPFFCGSPPSRVSNPLIQDSRFGDEKCTPVSPRAIPTPSGLSPSSARKPGGCVRANFGHNSAVRVEGFDCLDRDRRNCSIPALA
ncbi:hypothetical protein CASFOL_020624 [Castilleja foliolosa]|uniref:Uncharacterized protein n=1 Tax=Castilleja foliolosa TaxID=1961234 RepID=A0ABD3D5N0_9LAMI